MHDETFLPDSARSRPSRLRRRPLAIGLAAALACAATQAPAIASTGAGAAIPVTSCADAGPGSLRAAVASALSGDHIEFADAIGCSVVTLTSGPIVIGNDAGGQPFASLDIAGLVGAITIDGGGLDRVFVQDAGSDALLTLRHFTITHGTASGSGGCILAHGNIELDDVEVTACRAGVVSGDAVLGNTAVRGGGVYAGNAATLDNSVVSANVAYGNAAYAYGGGVFARNAITLTSSTIADNGARSDGGAVYGAGIAAGDRDADAQATITLVSSDITGNQANSACDFCAVRGGGVWTYGNMTSSGGEISGNDASSAGGYGTGAGLYFNARFGAAPVSATIAGTHFHCNTADGSAGGIGAGGDLSIAGSILDCNSAQQDGGAIELFGGNLTLTDSTLCGNIALGRGGGIFLFGYGDVATSNSTISGNVAADGGGIGNTYGSLHIANTTIAFNQAFEHGGGVYERYAYYPFELRSTIIANNSGPDGPQDVWPPGLSITGSHDLVVAASGVDLPADTLSGDPLLGALTDNGGATLTRALGTGSPAIDAGSNEANLPFDQRGVGFVRVYGAAADIGAFEAQPTTSEIIFVDGFDPS